MDSIVFTSEAALPPVCACCLEPRTRSRKDKSVLGYQPGRVTFAVVELPSCATCARADGRRTWVGLLTGLGAGALAAGLLFLVGAAPVYVALLGFIGFAAGLFLGGLVIAPATWRPAGNHAEWCMPIRKAVRSPHGLELTFRNPAFTAACRAHTAKSEAARAAAPPAAATGWPF